MTIKPPTTAAPHDYIIDKDGCLIPNPDLQPSHPPLYTITGTIIAIEICGSSINLLESLQKGTLITGAVAAATGMGGMAANASSIAFYDGEDIEHVAMLLDDQLVIGTFVCAQELKVGNEVTVVVYKPDDETPPFAYAILREKDQLLWMPYNRNRTRHGWSVHACKLMGLILFCSLILISSVIFISSISDGDSFIEQWIKMIIYSPFYVALLALIGYLSVRPNYEDGELVEGIFKTLEIPAHKYFRIAPFSLGRLVDSPTGDDRAKKDHIYRYDLALAAHKKKYRIK